MTPHEESPVGQHVATYGGSRESNENSAVLPNLGPFSVMCCFLIANTAVYYNNNNNALASVTQEIGHTITVHAHTNIILHVPQNTTLLLLDHATTNNMQHSGEGGFLPYRRGKALLLL